jgi:AcrR family transcriptional regulator
VKRRRSTPRARKPAARKPVARKSLALKVAPEALVRDSVAPKPATQPSRNAADATSDGADHAARQRARILDAAERCFIEHGFHAASMADITATAGMSAGLLYRYFNGKNQIVQAIIERHLETDGCQAMGAIHTCADFTREALERYERWRRRDDPGMNAALMLELSAEAARDPEILRVTRRKDQAIAKSLTGAVQRAAQAEGVVLPDAEAQVRAVVMQCLVEGLACRAVRDPELSAKQLEPVLSKVIAALMG